MDYGLRGAVRNCGDKANDQKNHSRNKFTMKKITALNGPAPPAHNQC